MARVSGGRWAYLAEIEKQKAETARHRDQFDMSRGGLKALGGTVLDLGKTLGVEYAKWKLGGGEEKAGLDVAKKARMDAGTDIILGMDAGPGGFPQAVRNLGDRKSFAIGDIKAAHTGATSVSRSGGRQPPDPSIKFLRQADQYRKVIAGNEKQIERLEAEDRANNTNKNAARVASLKKKNATALTNIDSLLLRAGVHTGPVAALGTGVRDDAGITQAGKQFGDIGEQFNLGGDTFGSSERLAAVQEGMTSYAFQSVLDKWAEDTGKNEMQLLKVQEAILSQQDPREALNIINSMGASVKNAFDKELRRYAERLAEQRGRLPSSIAPTIMPQAVEPTEAEKAALSRKAIDAYRKRWPALREQAEE